MSEPMPALPGGPDPVGDSDKLPWLEPYRERSAKSEPPAPPTVTLKAVKPRRHRSGTALLGVVGALALGAGGYWFGRETAPTEIISPRTTVIAPLPPSPVPVQRDGELPYRSLDDQSAAPVVTAEAPESARLAPTKRAADRSRHATHRARPIARPHRAVPPPPPAPPPPPRPRVMVPAPPVFVSPAPVLVSPPPAPAVVVHRNLTPSVGGPGEVIELGAFISRRTANAAFRRVVRRYPYLGTRPKVVTPFPRSAGWPPVYRLRLGTGSTRNARILCRYVHSIGQRCSVV